MLDIGGNGSLKHVRTIIDPNAEGTKTLGSIHNLPRGWSMMILRGGGSLFFPTMIQGVLWKISNENYIEHRGGANHSFLKKKRK